MENLVNYKIKEEHCECMTPNWIPSIVHPTSINAYAHNFGKQNILFVQTNRCYTRKILFEMLLYRIRLMSSFH